VYATLDALRAIDRLVRMASAGDTTVGDTSPRIAELVRKYWGFDHLRPLQREAIHAAVACRDSLLVMPTGGGKSLCYQVPPLLDDRTDIVVSPLISLMKDQVDGLKACGYPAQALHSGLDHDQRRRVQAELHRGKLRLLFVSPERLVTDDFLAMLDSRPPRRIAVDEAHCISQWGHDFRPEYRQLAVLRRRFPDASLHAFTATATPRVRQDIVQQLDLRDPAVLVGTFDRPNLVYRIQPQIDVSRQIIQAIRGRPGQAAIVYCISRKDTESIAATLRANGVAASAYHAGLDAIERHRTQEAFSNEQLDVVVATVAFGMGIDRSNVRCVIHAAMPKTVEHYQQETGRAGRDGLAAECVLFYSYSDVARWEGLIRRSAQEADQPRQVIDAQLELLHAMQRVCNSAVCRHKTLSEYFGQPYDKLDCGACDVCLGDNEAIEDGTVAARKILSCVARVQERFGVGHVVDVLAGADTQPVRRNGHHTLSTYGLMKEVDRKQLTSWVHQLVDQGLLARSEGDRPVLVLNEESWRVMRGQRSVRLIRPKAKAAAAGPTDLQGADRDLFDQLRAWRKSVAARRGVPPFTVFHDSTLIELARVRPTSADSLQAVAGIGARKAADFGPAILQIIAEHCQQRNVAADQAEHQPIVVVRKSKPNSVKDRAMAMFKQGCPVAEVAAATGRALSTTHGYLAEFITRERPDDIRVWVDPQVYSQVVQTAKNLEPPTLTPIYQALEGRVSYDTIRLVLAHRSVQSP
jgi:ATP-dependent DNA helicase RecQ